VTEAEATVTKAEESGKAAKESFAAEAPEVPVEKAVEDLSGEVNTAREALAAVRTRVSELAAMELEAELKLWLAGEAKKLDMKVMAQDARLVAVCSILERGRAILAQQAAAELAKIKAEAGKLLRSKKLSTEELFKEGDKDEDGSLSKSEFLALLKGCEACEMTDEKVEKLFAAYTCEGQENLGADELLLITRGYYVVVGDSVLTDQATIENAQTLRRLDLKEVLELLEEPVQDEAANLPRARFRAVRDSMEGYVSVSSNTGSALLSPTDAIFEVIRPELPLTADCDPEGEVVRPLKAGERLEVLEWDKQATNGNIRVRAKVRGSTSKGWATRAGPDGMPTLRMA